MRARAGTAVLCGALTACGAAPPHSVSPPPATATCDTAHDEAVQAGIALGMCLFSHLNDPQRPAHTLVSALASHWASLEPAREVSEHEAQELAEQIWHLLDGLPSNASTHDARNRGEMAAEQLLRDRGSDVARAAAEEAIAAVDELAPFVDAPGDPCNADADRAHAAEERETACQGAPP